MKEFLIVLNLAIYKNDDIPRIEFDSIDELIEYVDELRQFDCVWAVSSNSDLRGDEYYAEHMVTDSIDKIILALKSNMFSLTKEKNQLFIFEYQSFEDAYGFCLESKEGHPKCYKNR